jgi:biopolymer transport protein ExbD
MAMSVPTEGSDEGEVIAEMNTTPLIDVMLVLLIMLIITIPIQTHAVKLNMPTGGASTVTELPKVVQVAVSSTGSITWDGVLIADRGGLESRIVEAVQMNPQPEVHVRPDRSARYEVVAMIMATSQKLGLTKIGLTGNEQFVGD